MNDTFDFSRFSKLLAFDGRKYIRNFGLTLAILCGLNLVLWLLTLIFGFTMPTLPRWVVICLAMLLAILLVPSKSFGDINLPREGVRFAMLPVSNLEKYLSYTLFCLLTPGVVLLASWGFDSLLTLLPIGGFTHYIKGFGYGSVMQNFILEISELAEQDLTQEEDFNTIVSMFGAGYSTSMIIKFFFTTGIFMLGNLLFKTHKAGKTLACMIGVSYVLSMLMQIFLVSKGFFPWLNKESMGVSVDLETITTLTDSMVTFSNIFHILLTIGLFIGIYFKLKNQKY